MNPSEITLDQAKREIGSLIKRYPERDGRIATNGQWGDDQLCVYYLDESGTPLETPYSDDRNGESVVFALPICIIGQWIEEFHPHLKGDELMREILFRNQSLCMTNVDDSPFDCDVHNLLSDVQSCQDRFGTQWKDIDLSQWEEVA